VCSSRDEVVFTRSKRRVLPKCQLDDLTAVFLTAFAKEVPVLSLVALQDFMDAVVDLPHQSFPLLTHRPLSFSPSWPRWPGEGQRGPGGVLESEVYRTRLPPIENDGFSVMAAERVTRRASRPRQPFAAR
jgi:hypothetical protein